MPQLAVAVANVDDVPALKSLLDDALRSQTGFVQSMADDIVSRVADRISDSQRAQAAGLRPTYRLMIATKDGEPIGFASMSSVESGIMGPPRNVLIDAIHVVDSARKSGAGTSLLRSCIDFADAVGAAEISVEVSNTREENRFLARNGFGPMTSRRVGSVDALRRAWGLDTKPDPNTGQLSEAQRQRRRRLLLNPRGSRRSTRTNVV